MFEELSLHLLDIAMNSLAARARTIQIVVNEDARHDLLFLRVRDDGCGMDEETLRRALAESVSTKTSRTKPIGLGLALLKQTSEMCGGIFHVRSRPGHGTTVTASMQLSHVDRPPLGDLSGTILTLCAAAGPGVDVQLSYRSDGENFRFSLQEQDGGGHVKGIAEVRKAA